MTDESSNAEVKAFLNEVEIMLHQIGRPFTGIFVTCRYCKEPALAASPEAAATFGWTEVRPVSESYYLSICMDCNRISNFKEIPMKDWLDIGPSPPDERCAQMGTEDYFPLARLECRAYMGLLRRVLGPEPTGAQLGIRSNPHDFGDYLSVVCYYDPDIQETVDYAFKCESDGPDNWDEQARRELEPKKGGAA